MIKEELKYCLVCENYDLVKGHCMRGWNNSFCDGDNFEPSFIWTVYNFLEYSVEEGKMKKEEMNKLFEWVKNLFGKFDND